ncbi:MAG: DUF2135 domain-containing protein [Treponema sp.]|nr:DUF2135 domain-containing protein [Treponema sp.]
MKPKSADGIFIIIEVIYGGLILNKFFSNFFATLIFSLSIFCGSQKLFSQASSIHPLPEPVQPLPIPGFIRMNLPENDGSVRLSQLSVDVEIFGNIAVTCLDMIFENTSSRTLEGEFEFPLGENESVIGYALDINGKLRKGVVVEKDKGRQVFEAVVRQGIDPGLVEMTAGNNFKTRVYPLPAKGRRHVQITYQSELKSAADAGIELDNFQKDSNLYYKYAALTSEKLDSFTFKISVLDYKNSSFQKEPLFDSENTVIDFSSMTSAYSATFTKKDYEIKKPFTIAIPKSPAKDNQIFFTQTIGKETYFYAALPSFSDEDSSNFPSSRPKKLPQNLIVWWDISASGAKRDLQKEIALLNFYIASLKNPSVTIVPFCNEIHEARVFKGNSKSALKEISDFICSLEYDGATNLDYDFVSAFPGDEVLLFTDGISNWTDSNQSSTKKDRGGKSKLLSTINSSPSADNLFLQNLAKENGGIYINLAEKSLDAAVELLKNEPYHLISVKYNNSELEELYPLPGEIADENGFFAITGKLRKKEASMELIFGYGKSPVKKVKLNVNVWDGISCDYVSRQWAGKKINALSLDYDSNSSQIMELAKKFGIVTKDTSLIVLDSVEDYVRYGILPPEELLDQYNRILQNKGNFKEADSSENSSQIPESVYRTFKEFRDWWNKEPKDFKKRAGKGEAYNEGMILYETSDSFAPAASFDEEVFVTNSLMGSDALEALPLSRSQSQLSSSRNLAASPKSKSENPNPKSKIQLEDWNPDSPYLSILKKTRREEMYQKYLELKEEYASSPAFYMEVSDYFAEEELDWQSIRILSNLAELNLESTDLLRALGNKLIERKLYNQAIPVFQKLLQLKGEVPQFYRDLALAFYYGGEAQKAVDLLYSAVCRTWDGRFDQVQQILLNDMNAIIAACQKTKQKVDVSAIDQELIQNFDLDVRIVLTWNTDDCDIDLWVTDKDKEKCFYGNRITRNGARLSRDFTQGYGPEEFCIKNAPDGKLKIEVNYFANHQQKLLQPITVQAEVYTNFGRPNQECQILTLQLDSIKGTFLVGEVEK